jgi:CRP-like cAMP-binding protein
VSNPVANAILQKFEKALVATTSLRSGLESLKYDVRRVTAGSILVREGSFPQSTMLVLEGCIFRHKITGDVSNRIQPRPPFASNHAPLKRGGAGLSM